MLVHIVNVVTLERLNMLIIHAILIDLMWYGYLL